MINSQCQSRERNRSELWLVVKKARDEGSETWCQQSSGWCARDQGSLLQGDAELGPLHNADQEAKERAGSGLMKCPIIS